MFREKIPAIGRIGSLLVLIVAIVVIVAAFIRARRQPPLPGYESGPPVLSGKVVSIIEDYKYTEPDPKTGRKKLQLLAAKDIAYEDGRHELEKVDLTAFYEKGKSLRVISDRGSFLRDPSLVTFSGAVKVMSSDGLEVTTETIIYEQQSEIARTEVPVQFRHGEVSGSSAGATLRFKDHVLTLPQSPHVIIAGVDPNKKGIPVEIRGDRAEYVEKDGTVKFEGNVNVTQGERLARADLATGFVNPKAKKLERIEARGSSRLESREKGQASDAESRDMDFFFDEERRLKSSAAYGAARARSLEPDSPREITAERIDITYSPTEDGSRIQLISAHGRAVMKLEAILNSPKEGDWSERLVEADAMQASLRDDGKNLARAEAAGGAVLTITPKRITPRSEKKTLRAPRFTADFFETGNAIKTFVAESNAVAEFDPMTQPESKEKDATAKRFKKTLSGRKMIANFSPETQDVSDMTVDGDAKFTEGERAGTSARAVYTAWNQNVAMRGKPQVWDPGLRASANEIDANVETGESELRGRARTTYFNRDSTDGAAPFKNRKDPITVASDRAIIKHNEGAARYIGAARMWQGEDFVRAEYIELDKGERVMTAWNNAQSAFYNSEREVEKGRKEIVPVFASSDRIIYTDANRTAHYEGAVKIRQGTDQIDSATADAVMDEENNLVSLTASKNVVMTQPSRRATGDQVVYTAATDTAILTGNFAMVEDREREAVTKSPKLTLHLRDARIEANDDNSVGSGVKRRVKTTHRIQN